MKELEERRYISPSVELRKSDDGGMVVSGYAAVFDKRSADLGWFVEEIDRRAFDGVLGANDVVCLLNHDKNLLLGRESSGTLKLKVDERGLYMENILPPNPLGQNVDVWVQRGDIKHQSFAFVVAEDKWSKVGDKELRTITKIKKLIDVSLVTDPAYPDTSVAKRSLDTHKTSETAGDIDATVENEDIDIELTLNRHEG